MLNPFTSDAFSMTSLTAAINILPNLYGRLKAFNLFPGKGVATRSIAVEEKNGVLNLLQTQPVGAPGQQSEHAKRTVRNFTIPHIPLDDAILPDSYQGVRAFGSENEMAGLAEVVNDRLQSMRNKHAITLEHLRMGALKGIILDADGTTLYNLYTEFGISAKTVTFDASLPDKCLDVARHIEDNLKGEVMTGIHCLCSEGFFDAIISDTDIQKAYLNHSLAAEMLGKDVRKGFTYRGITFEEYRANATNAAGTTMKFIADNEAHFFPVGTSETFRTIFAPADFTETANTLGIELYAKAEPRQFNRGIDLHTQSNPLPICYRPGLLVKGTLS